MRKYTTTASALILSREEALALAPNDPNRIRYHLWTNPKAVERGLMIIYRNQTDSEQNSGSTKESNGVGFNMMHASKGTYMAKWVESGKPLTGKWLDLARKMCLFYIRQIVEVATQRMLSQAAQLAAEQEAIQLQE